MVAFTEIAGIAMLTSLSPRRSALAVVLAAFLSLVGAAFTENALGDIIGEPGFISPTAGGFGGFWIGTYTNVPGFPGGVDSFTVAQLIPSYYDYTHLDLKIQMYGDTQSTVDLSLAPNNNGSPGTPIATQSITFTSADNNYSIFTLPLQNAALQAGTWYWLVASSPTVLAWNSGYSPPVWLVSPGYDFPLAYSQNGGPWIFGGNDSFAYELDGIPDQNYVSPGPIIESSTVPEPSSLVAWSGLAVMGLAMAWRR